MISGFLFLSRDIEISKLLKKYVLRMVIAFFTWSFIYYLFNEGTVKSQFLALFQNEKTLHLKMVLQSHYHLWFVTTIIGMYLCVPIFKKIVEDIKIGRYYLLLSFIFCFSIPFITYLVNDFANEKVCDIVNALNGNIYRMFLNFIISYAFYFILGYYIATQSFNKKQRIIIYILGIIGFLSTILLSEAASLGYEQKIETYYDYFNVNVVFEALAVFELFKNIKFKEGILEKVIRHLSKLSFGAYLVHLLIVEQLVGRIGLLNLNVSPYLSIPIIVAFVTAISFLISAVLNLIPVVKKYIV